MSYKKITKLIKPSENLKHILIPKHYTAFINRLEGFCMQILGRDVLVSMGIMLLFICLDSRRKKAKILTFSHILLLCLTFFMAQVFSLTGVTPLSGFHTDIHWDEINLIPFSGIHAVLSSGMDMYAILNIVGNAILLVPFGFFFPLLSQKKYSLWQTALSGLLISLLIECSQLFLGRGTDVDDLILNTLGAVLGYIVFQLFKRILPRLTSIIKKESLEAKNSFLLVNSIFIPYLVIVLLGFYDRFRYFSH